MLKVFKYRKKVIGGLLSGLLFAVLMAIFDHVGHKDFDILKFLFYTIGYGILASLLFFNRKSDKKTDTE